MRKARVSKSHVSCRLGVSALSLILVSISANFLPQTLDAGEPRAKNILVLYSFSDRSLFDSLDSLKSAIRDRAHGPVNFEVEYLETQRLLNPDYEKSLSETLHDAYGAEKFDAVVVAAYPALQFAVAHRNEMFPG